MWVCVCGFFEFVVLSGLCWFEFWSCVCGVCVGGSRNFGGVCYFGGIACLLLSFLGSITLVFLSVCVCLGIDFRLVFDL